MRRVAREHGVSRAGHVRHRALRLRSGLHRGHRLLCRRRRAHSACKVRPCIAHYESSSTAPNLLLAQAWWLQRAPTQACMLRCPRRRAVSVRLHSAYRAPLRHRAADELRACSAAPPAPCMCAGVQARRRAPRCAFGPRRSLALAPAAPAGAHHRLWPEHAPLPRPWPRAERGVGGVGADHKAPRAVRPSLRLHGTSRRAWASRKLSVAPAKGWPQSLQQLCSAATLCTADCSWRRSHNELA